MGKPALRKISVSVRVGDKLGRFGHGAVGGRMMERAMENGGKMSRPKSVVCGLILLWTSLAIGLARIAIRWDSFVALGQSAAIADPVTFQLVVVGGVVAVTSFLILKISVGRNWARIMYLVPTVIGLPFYFPLRDDTTSLQVGIEIIALALLFVPVSNEWFRRMRALRLSADLREIERIRQKH